MTPFSFMVKYKWCILAIAAITFLSLLPQVRFWLIRGSEWQGSYVTLQPDETVYSAYVAALIDGRPRRTDPTTGQDHSPQSPLPESLFSIQIVPPFIIALIAKVFGATASTAFIVLLGLAGLLTSLSVFWLFKSLTGDSNFSALAILIVLCFGAIAGGHGIVGVFVTSHAKLLGMPFLRRYEPAAAMPLFFVLQTLIWSAFGAQSRRVGGIKAALAGAILAVLIFSYFYLWTAAAAWLVCVGCLWFLLGPGDRRAMIWKFVIASIPIVIALGLYGYLLSKLPHATSKAQVLTYTHRPDLLRIPEIIGAVTIAALIWSALRNKVSFNSPVVIFIASFALLPFLVFNQQILTGRLIQPFHYEVLIVNYVALMGLVLLIKVVFPVIHGRALLLIACLCVVWAIIEINLPFQVQRKLFIEVDETVPVLLRLRASAQSDGTWEALRQSGRTPGLVFSPQFGISQLLPVWAPQGSALAPGSESFQSMSDGERKERLFTHFYYCGKTKENLREILNGGVDPFLTMSARSIIFGVDRVTPVLGWDFQPIRSDEIEPEVKAYESFVNSFGYDQARKYPLMYVVTRADEKIDFSHLDLWYERDGGQPVGKYIMYRIQQRL